MENLQIRSALVTGATGFIGQHLVHYLKNNGYKVNVLVRGQNNNLANEGVTIFRGDIFNTPILKEAVKGVDVVFHLVAKTHDFSKGKSNDKEYFTTNVDGTKNILEVCSESKIKHFVYFSSVKVNGEESTEPLNEKSVNPITPYGESKFEAEKLVASFGAKCSFMTTSLRLPLVYGPENKGNVFNMIRAIDRGRFVLIGRGDAKRSMVYVGNVVASALNITGKPKADGQVFIVTDGVDYTIQTLCEEITEKLGKDRKLLCIPLKVARLLALVGDIGGFVVQRALPFNSELLGKLINTYTLSSNKIQSEMGFTPKYTLPGAMKETVAWYKKLNENERG